MISVTLKQASNPDLLFKYCAINKCIDIRPSRIETRPYMVYDRLTPGLRPLSSARLGPTWHVLILSTERETLDMCLGIACRFLCKEIYAPVLVHRSYVTHE